MSGLRRDVFEGKRVARTRNFPAAKPFLLWKETGSKRALENLLRQRASGRPIAIGLAEKSYGAVVPLRGSGFRRTSEASVRTPIGSFCRDRTLL